MLNRRDMLKASFAAAITTAIPFTATAKAEPILLDVVAGDLLSPPSKLFSTGLPKLDGLLGGGLRAGDITIIAGGIASGKGILARNIAEEYPYHVSRTEVNFLDGEFVSPPSCILAKGDLHIISENGILEEDMDTLDNFGFSDVVHLELLHTKKTKYEKYRYSFLEKLQEVLKKNNATAIITSQMRRVALEASWGFIVAPYPVEETDVSDRTLISLSANVICLMRESGTDNLNSMFEPTAYVVKSRYGNNESVKLKYVVAKGQQFFDGKYMEKEA
jgi:hypothetical protein